MCPTMLTNNERNVRDLWNHNHTGGLWPSQILLENNMEVEKLAKIHVFSWRMGYDILPTYGKISSVSQNFKKDYPRCGMKEETFIHALKDCLTAWTILTFCGLDNRLLVGDYYCCIDWIKDVTRVLDMKVERAKTFYQDFRIHNFVNNPMLPISPACKKWEKPPCSYAKINFDATVSKNKVGFGVIVRDSDGFVLGGSGGFKDNVLSIEWAELFAFEESLKVACAINISKAIFASDCANLVNRVKKLGKDITILGYCIDEACKQMDKFNSVDVIWANRNCNKVANFVI
ncbi:hypothetical protein Gotur_022299 [Gossypium turneri]